MTDVVWILGPRGVGTSTVGFTLLLQLARPDTPVGYIDLAQVGWCPPTPDAHRVRAANARALLSVHRDAGARFVLLVGSARPVDVARYAEAAAPSRLRVCRLGATAPTLRERLGRRAAGEGVTLPGEDLADATEVDLDALAAQSARETAELRDAAVGDVVVATDGRTPHEVLTHVLAALPL